MTDNIRHLLIARMAIKVRDEIAGADTDDIPAAVERGIVAGLAPLAADVLAVLGEPQPHFHLARATEEICTVCKARRRLTALFDSEAEQVSDGTPPKGPVCPVHQTQLRWGQCVECGPDSDD